MKADIRNLVIDLGLLGGAIFLSFLGLPLNNGRWIFLLLVILLIGITIVRAKNLGMTWIPQDVNQKNLSVAIDKDSCMGVGSCVNLAPQVFKIDDSDLKSAFISSAPLIVLNEKGASSQTVLQAAMSCPYKAIILSDKATGEQVFP